MSPGRMVTGKWSWSSWTVLSSIGASARWTRRWRPSCTPTTSARWPGELGVLGARGRRCPAPRPEGIVCLGARQDEHSHPSWMLLGSQPVPGDLGALVLRTLWDLSPLATQPQPELPLGCWAVLWGCSRSVPQQQQGLSGAI